MRKPDSKLYLSTIAGILLVAMALGSTLACGNGSAASSTTLGSSAETSTTTTVGEDQTTTTAVDQTGGETTTSVDGTGGTTPSTEAATTTTEAAPTTDTVDHAAEIRAQYPSTESFTNSNWATLSAAPASHLGAAVDIIGQPSNDTVDPDSKYLTWQLSVPAAGGQALCRTNIGMDRSLLSGNGWVEVRGIVVGAQGSDVGGGPIIYVESIQKAAEPTTPTT